MRFWWYILLSIGSLFWANHSFAATLSSPFSKNIAIFYPEAKEPYRSIYQEILSGTNKASSSFKYKIKLVEFSLKKNFDLEKIKAELTVQNINKVIALGRVGYQLAKKLPKHFNVISGALPIRPNGISGVSLISDPEYLFKYLTLVAPNVSSVHVAYSNKSQWLIELAIVAAKQQGLTLHLKKVSSTKQAIQFYQNLFKSDISNQDAIWLPLDRISSQDKVTLPVVLEKAWSKEVIVFSSKPSHVKRGALFSTYPDNLKLGEQLFKMILDLAESPEETQFAPLSSLQLAVNMRTAAHLGLKYDSKQRQQFKLTFPE